MSLRAASFRAGVCARAAREPPRGRAIAPGARADRARGGGARAFEEPGIQEGLAWRFGLTLHSLSESRQPKPFAYPGFGARRRTDEWYFALDTPGPAALADLALAGFQLGAGIDEGVVTFFESLNEPSEYVFFEVLHLRVGKSWRPEGSRAIWSAGAVGVADWVVFAASGLEEPVDSTKGWEDLLTVDPFVVGAGVFGALGARNERWAGDVSLSVARDLLSPGGYEPAVGWVASLELDGQVRVARNFGLYARIRQVLYTHIAAKRTWATTGSSGAAFRF